MSFHSRRRVLAALTIGAGACALGISARALAAKYPAKPIRLIVPFPAGGPTDIVARPFAKFLGDALGQSMVIDNRGGAGGSIGAMAVASAPPDGYTLLLGTVGTNAINPSLYRKLSYSPDKDFTPIATLASAPVAIVVSQNSGIATLADLVAKAKAKPATINYGSAGNGTPGHLTGELFAAKAGIKLSHVPYKGSAPAMTELIGGQIPLMFDPLQSVLPHVKSGKIRILAVTSRQRFGALPDVQTVAEQGYPGFEALAWWALYGPAALPANVTERLMSEAQKIVQSSEFGSLLTPMGLQPMSVPLSDFQRSEAAKWSDAVRSTGITIE